MSVRGGREIFAYYKSEKISAIYFPSTHHVEIMSGALRGTVHQSPSTAAKAITRSAKRGTMWWKVTGTNRPLISIIRPKFRTPEMKGYRVSRAAA